jgi:hypothetical protein
MNELMKSENQTPVVEKGAGVKVGQWLGRREAFSLMAGRCSAAEIEIVRKIRDERMYEELNCSWDECCSRYLHASRRTVERELGYLRKYGPAFFTVRQLAHITVKEYQSIAGHITDQGVNLDGAVVALSAQNSDQVAAAVEALLKRVGPAPRKPAAQPETFDSLLERCEAIAQQLQSLSGALDPTQRLELGRVVAGIRAAAASLGVTIWDRH